MTDSTAEQRALYVSDSWEDGPPDMCLWISLTSMYAFVDLMCLATTSLATSYTSSTLYFGTTRMSIQKDHDPGMVLTLRTVAEAFVGSKLDLGGMKSGSSYPNFLLNVLTRSVMSAVPTLKALTPLSGVEACTDLPVTSNCSHMRLFSLTSIYLPSGLPQSGTRNMSSAEKYPWSMR